MQRALELATQAAQQGEVPVGAVVINRHSKKIIAEAHNEVEALKDPTAHAELLALRRASLILDQAVLDECDIYVSLEPCAMCAAAISHARIGQLYFGAYDPKGGGVDHGARVFSHPACHHKPAVYGGINEQEAGKLLQDFFKALR
ncbi:MAG: nucleoside deaminase [Dongiaceae bacterium]